MAEDVEVLLKHVSSWGRWVSWMESRRSAGTRCMGWQGLGISKHDVFLVAFPDARNPGWSGPNA